MKRYFIRIYIHHDKDLAILRKYYKFDVAKAVYCSMKAFLKREVFVINLPEKRKKPLTSKRVYSSQLKLREGKDDDLITLLESVSTGYRNIFMKNILRQYLCMPLLEEFFEDPDQEEKLLFKNIFRTGKRKANSGDLKSWYKNGDEKTDSHIEEKTYKEPIKKKEKPMKQQPKNEIQTEPQKELLNKPDTTADINDDDLTSLFSSLMS